MAGVGLENQQLVSRAKERLARGTIRVYHSCDPLDATVLTHFHAGKYTPRTGYDCNYPEQSVLIPRRHGKSERVLRCAILGCKTCQLTSDDANDLSLHVAMDHGIHGVPMRPTPRTTVEGVLRDGLARGEWMWQGANMNVPDQTLRHPQFHPLAYRCGSILNWLHGIPFVVEHQDSTPDLSTTVVDLTRDTPPYVPPPMIEGDLKVGVEAGYIIQER